MGMSGDFEKAVHTIHNYRSNMDQQVSESEAQSLVHETTTQRKSRKRLKSWKICDL